MELDSQIQRQSYKNKKIVIICDKLGSVGLIFGIEKDNES